MPFGQWVPTHYNLFFVRWSALLCLHWFVLTYLGELFETLWAFVFPLLAEWVFRKGMHVSNRLSMPLFEASHV